MRRLLLLAAVLSLPALAAAAARGWRYDGTGVYPDTRPPGAWDEKDDRGIAWKTPLPGMSHASPLVIGDRVFVTSEPYDLVCLDLASGEIRWRRENSQFPHLPEEKVEAGRALLAEERELVAANQAWAEQVESLRNALNRGGEKELTRGDSWRGPFERCAGPGDELPQDAALAERWRDLATRAAEHGFAYNRVGSELNREQHAGNRERIRTLAQDYAEWYESRNRGWHRITGRCFAAPVTDGEAVYVSFANNVVAAYDPAGEPRWSTWDHRPRAEVSRLRDLRRALHFTASPLVVGDLLVVAADKERIRAYARTDGTKRWETAYPKRGKNLAGTPARLRLGDTDLVVGANGLVYRAADGAVLADDLPPCGGGASPMVADGVVYMLVPKKSKSEHKGLVAVELEAAGADAVSWRVRWAIADIGDTTRMPALHDGLLYHVKDKRLVVYAAADGELVHHASAKVPRHHTTFSIAGDRLFAKGMGDEVMLFSLGREPEQAGGNRLQIDKGDHNYAHPSFAGPNLLIRTHGALYCLRE